MVVNNRMLYSSLRLNIELPEKFSHCLMCRVRVERNLVWHKLHAEISPMHEASLWWPSGQAQSPQGRPPDPSFLAPCNQIQKKVCERQLCRAFLQPSLARPKCRPGSSVSKNLLFTFLKPRRPLNLKTLRFCASLLLYGFMLYFFQLLSDFKLLG